MFTDPQSITVATVAQSMPRISTAEQKSIYQKADGTYALTLSHQAAKKRIRRMARFDKKAIVADPLTAVNDYEKLGVYLVVDEPEYGFSDQDIADMITGFIAWFTAGNIAKFLGNET